MGEFYDMLIFMYTFKPKCTCFSFLFFSKKKRVKKDSNGSSCREYLIY